METFIYLTVTLCYAKIKKFTKPLIILLKFKKGLDDRLKILGLFSLPFHLVY